MAYIDDLKSRVIDIVKDDVERRLCLNLIEEIQKHVKEYRGAWTYQALSRWVGVKPTDPLFLDCVNFLAGSSAAKALNINFLFFDPADPEDIGSPLSPEQVELAFGKGVFYHPDKGEPVPDFKRTLVPYFTPVPELVQEPRGRA